MPDTEKLKLAAAKALGLVDIDDLDREKSVASLNNGDAWNGFCDNLRKMGAEMLASEFAGNDLERAEGYRNLLGLLSWRLNKTLYACGPDLPSFVRGGDDVVKIALDNPDGTNSNYVDLQDCYTYRIFGKRGLERYVEFVQQGATGTLSNHYLDEFEIGRDGEFEIFLSREAPAEKNWMPLEPGVKNMFVRQIQYDWPNEPLSSIQIERPGVTGVPQCLRIPDPAQVGMELDSMGKTLVLAAEFWREYTRGFRTQGDNVIPVDQPLAMSGYSAVRASPKGFFDLAPEEALLLELEPPEGSFWSVAIGDVWFRTIDPSYRHTSLNGFQAKIDSDGMCRVVIAHRDPGIANWLDTSGHARGHMIFRFVRTKTTPRVSSRVIPYADIMRHLPAGTACVTSAERAKIIEDRSRARSRRYAGSFTSRWSI